MGLIHLMLVENDAMFQYDLPVEHIRKRLQKNPDALAYMSAKIKDHEDLVRSAVEYDGRTLVYASERLRNKPELCLLALSKPMEPEERSTVLAAIGPQARADKALMRRLCALFKSSEPLYHAAPSVLDDFETMVACARLDGRCVLQASARLRSDVAFALEVGAHCPRHLTFMASEIRNHPQASFFDEHMDGVALLHTLRQENAAPAPAQTPAPEVLPQVTEQGARVMEWTCARL